MSLTATCKSCGKSYTVGDQFAGRKAKCKNCGGVVVVPALPKAADDEPDINAIDIEPPAEPRKVPRPAPPIAARDEEEDEQEAPRPRSKSQKQTEDIGAAMRPKPRMNIAQYYSLVYVGVPLVLILAGYGLPITLFYLNIFGGAAHLKTIVLLMACVVPLLYLAVVLPLTLVGLKVAAQVQRFDLVEKPYLAVLAAFATAPVFFYLAERSYWESFPAFVSPHDPRGTLFTGMAWAVVPAFLVLWLLLRVDVVKTAIAWLIGVAGYFLGIFLAYGIIMVGGVIFDRVAHDTYTRWVNGDSLPAPAAPTQSGPGNSRPSTGTEAMATRQNLHLIGMAFANYLRANHGFAPASLDMLKDQGLPASALVSPYGHPSSGPDYAYLLYDGEFLGVIGPQTIMYYDAGEPEHDGQRVTVQRAGGVMETLSGDDFQSSLTVSKQDIELSRPKSEAAMAALIAQQKQQQDLLDRLRNHNPGPGPGLGAGNPTPPGNNNNPPPPPVIPTIEAHPWSAATPDPALPPRRTLRPVLRLIIPHGPDLLYPAQTSTLVGVGDQFGGNSVNPTDVHDIWNLATATRIGRIVGALPLQDMAISPDGVYVGGMASGGQDVTALYQVWSFRTGNQVQTIAQTPAKQNTRPRIIGYQLGESSNADNLLVLGDALDVCEIRTGNIIHHVDLKVNWGRDVETAVSANGKLAAIADKDGRVTLIDTVAGKVLGDVVLPPTDSDPELNDFVVSFSPDGTQLALFIGHGRVVDWAVSNAKLLGDFKVPMTFNRGFARNQRLVPLVWLPDSSGWILSDDSVVDGVTGVTLYKIPPQTVQGAEEFGPRMLIDDTHVLMSFKALSNQLGFESVAIPKEVLARSRAAARASTQP